MYPIFATVLLCIPIATVRYGPYPLELYEKRPGTEHELGTSLPHVSQNTLTRTSN
jgi:hypothetical protein